MSSQPLLPSYASATGYHRYHSGQGQRDGTQMQSTPSARLLVDALCVIIFTTTAMISSCWASQSNHTPYDEIPPESAPLLPYFAVLALIISFFFWIGYIILINEDVDVGPRMQRQAVIGASVGGKLIIAVAHAAISYLYETSFPNSKQPDWMSMFLATQAWWDVFLVAVNWYLKLTTRTYW